MHFVEHSEPHGSVVECTEHGSDVHRGGGAGNFEETHHESEIIDDGCGDDDCGRDIFSTVLDGYDGNVHYDVSSDTQPRVIPKRGQEE